MAYLKRQAPSLLMIVLLAGFPQISETIYTPSLPDIARSLHTSNHLVQWTLSIYFIGFALGVFIWGSASDRFGRRRVMLTGIAIYCIGCLGCLSSTSIDYLLTSRFIQAFGASVGSVITQTIIRDVFIGKRRNQIYSTLVVALAVAPAVGPLIGGFLVQYFAWTANFVALLVMGVLLLVYNYTSLPESHPDLVNAKTQTPKWMEIAIRLAKDKRVWGCAIIVAGFNGIYFSFFAEGPFLIINLLHYSPIEYGMLGFLIAFASIIGGRISYSLNNHIEINRIIFIGCLVALVSSVIFLALTLIGNINAAHRGYVLFSIISAIVGINIGFGIAIPNVLSCALVDYKDVIGTAGSMFGFTYYVLIAMVVFFMGYIHNGTAYPMPIYFLGLSTVMMVVYFSTVHPVSVNENA